MATIKPTLVSNPSLNRMPKINPNLPYCKYANGTAVGKDHRRSGAVAPDVARRKNSANADFAGDGITNPSETSKS